MDMDELLPVLGRQVVLILNPRFTESSMTASEYADVERTAVWVGRTIAGMQIWDILRTVRWATEDQGLTPSRVAVYGKKEMGILALYAGLLDPRIGEVILNDPPASHRQSPALLNVLRLTDIPEVAGAFAPRRLTCLTAVPGAWGYAQDIYRLMDAHERFGRSPSLPEALEVWK